MGILSTTDLIHAMLHGDKIALARLVTMVENIHPDTLSIMQNILPSRKRPYVIGITGFPGAGKSSIVDKFISFYREKGLTVGVIAVDPSSPFSGGAMLGDRIRMKAHDQDDGVFIRSMATRGFLGGLTRNTLEIITLFSAFGFDRIIIETVGVGQDEVDIMELSHICIVTVVPGFGDHIQTLKAGLFEIADIFVINKMDELDPSELAASLQTLKSSRKNFEKIEQKSNVFVVSARENIHMDRLFLAVEELWTENATAEIVDQHYKKRLVDAQILSALFAVFLKMVGTDYNDFRKKIQENNINIYKEIENIVTRNS